MASRQAKYGQADKKLLNEAGEFLQENKLGMVVVKLEILVYPAGDLPVAHKTR